MPDPSLEPRCRLINNFWNLFNELQRHWLKDEEIPIIVIDSVSPQHSWVTQLRTFHRRYQGLCATSHLWSTRTQWEQGQEIICHLQGFSLSTNEVETEESWVVIRIVESPWMLNKQFDLTWSGRQKVEISKREVGKEGQPYRIKIFIVEKGGELIQGRRFDTEGEVILFWRNFLILGERRRQERKGSRNDVRNIEGEGGKVL